jgi:hypothetical protein
VPNSQGRDFYFYLQAPQTEGLRAFISRASIANARSDGEMVVGHRKWAQAEDLVFQPHYEGDPAVFSGSVTPAASEVPVLLTGGHAVGQTFRPDRNNLDGIWIPIDRFEQTADSTRFIFHLASPPLLPYSAQFDRVRLTLMLVLIALVIWRLIPRRDKSWQLWIYLTVIAGTFFGIQTILKSSNNAGYAFPLIFQFAVVFHYWSWYVFSFDKLRTKRPLPERRATSLSPYDKMLTYLGSTPHFTGAVIVLNLLSLVGVLWYYRLGGPTSLRFLFDYNYFLYFLVFHVTFSFRPVFRHVVSTTS